MKRYIVVAPHPDDETLGCGGSLLRWKHEGAYICWLIVTGMDQELGYTQQQMEERQRLIEEVAAAYGFDSVYKMGLPTTRLDTIPLAEITARISKIFLKVEPTDVFLPFAHDIHSDHRYVFQAASSCTKWFRHNYIKRVLAYETLSETDFIMEPGNTGFNPNYFVQIDDHLDDKIAMAQRYGGEMRSFPFPRSFEAIRALAHLRGAQAGCLAAEGFVVLKYLT